MDPIQEGLALEWEKFKSRHDWLLQTMPPAFFEELNQATVMLVVHSLMEFEQQEYYASIQLKNMAIVLCLDSPDADLRVLKNYTLRGISSYQSYLSNVHPPFLNILDKIKANLRIVVIHFYSQENEKETPALAEIRKKLNAYVHKTYPSLSSEDIEKAIQGIIPSFLQSQTIEQLGIAVAMYHRASSRDACQYEVDYIEDWETHDSASMQIILAWRNTPRHNFLYRLVRNIHRNGLIVKRISVSHKDMYSANSVLVMSLELHGKENRAVWDEVNIPNFVKELITIKYFSSFDLIDQFLVSPALISGDMGNLLRSMTNFIHQSLLNVDAHLYTLENVEEGLCRHTELAVLLCDAFNFRFNPIEGNEEKYSQIRDHFLMLVEKLDTGHEESDMRRKNILRQGMNFVHYTLKTNFYRPNYTSLSFRLDPKYLDEIPMDRAKKFPELPYGIFFIKGMHFFGFHIRFKDLARGGLRTVFPEHIERAIHERNNVFTECYNLALTQNMKNKDIPEGGAKGIIFLKPHDRIEAEAEILENELQAARVSSTEEIVQDLEIFRKEQKSEHLYQAQRSFIEGLVTLVNCDASGKLKAKDIVDYWGKPEFIYLGPDENMHDVMIQWIAEYSKKVHYKPGSSFISGKPTLGINHKEYGVTSLGVNVYVEAILNYIGIDPYKDVFTVKMSGGPDGDVAGNEICNLYKYYPKTAKLIALTDVSGTIYDPQGLDLGVLVQMFKKVQPINSYPYEKLHEGGFLVDKFTKRFHAPFVQKTLCWRKIDGKIIEDWLSGSDANHLLRYNVHQTPADIFIPGGGRPRTLNETNTNEFLDPTGVPTAKAIVEGANLYITPAARRFLEQLGVYIIKDSSANKTGVICSSFEVLSGLTLGDQKFLANKETLVKEILLRLKECAANEAKLLLETHSNTGEPLTEISDRISRRINLFTDQILDYLEGIAISDDTKDPLMKCYLDYCLPLLKNSFQRELLQEIPDIHKKAIISCYLASQLVYRKGLNWFPSIVDILPMLLEEKNSAL